MSDMDDEKKASIVYALPFPKKAEDMPENYDVAVYYDASPKSLANKGIPGQFKEK